MILEGVQGEATDMIWDLECFCCEERLRELGLFTLGKRRLRRVLINTYKYPKGGCCLKVKGARLFSVVPSGRTRVSGHKLKHRKFRLNMRKNFALRAAEQAAVVVHSPLTPFQAAV